MFTPMVKVTIKIKANILDIKKNKGHKSSGVSIVPPMSLFVICTQAYYTLTSLLSHM